MEDSPNILFVGLLGAAACRLEAIHSFTWRKPR